MFELPPNSFIELMNVNIIIMSNNNNNNNNNDPMALKYQDDIRQGIVKFYGQMKHSLELVGNYPEMVSQ